MNQQAQLITITPWGSALTLQRKKGAGIDLRDMGRADIRRASFVKFCKENQHFYVELAYPSGEGSGIRLGRVEWEAAGFTGRCACTPEGCDITLGHSSTFYFHDYEQAVAAEVAYFQARRTTQGVAREMEGLLA